MRQQGGRGMVLAWVWGSQARSERCPHPCTWLRRGAQGCLLRQVQSPFKSAGPMGAALFKRAAVGCVSHGNPAARLPVTPCLNGCLVFPG